MTITASRDCQVVGSWGSRTPQNTAQGGQETQSYQGGWGGQEQQEAWGSQGHQGAWGGQERLGWGADTRENMMADSSFPQQTFSNVLTPEEGGSRRGSEGGSRRGSLLARGPLALGGGQRGRGWSSGGPPQELLALISKLG